MPNEYVYELRRQIITESIREALVSLLMRAANDGHGMENRLELEELAEFLFEEIVRRAEWKKR
jgi:hypothetical protein